MSGSDQPIALEVVLPLPRAAAFSLVVDGIGVWWPPQFRLTGDPDAEIAIEPHLGGACTEQDGRGRRLVWGTVLSIEPPLYLRLAWQIAPGRRAIADPAAASRVMLSFRDAGETTRLELVHSEFVRHGEDAAAWRAELASAGGWPDGLARLAAAAGR
ncbi:SRPBCC family protein [Polymorphum gilvum]|uniref:Activator of Hsp90 ATPase homologue 1/2-like C-terminal domain-containing protein n=1 Tax=Polymorphum gilvum (strain LMG 25793 / CGMCC 1.9160 / SL003B-26A1) TaxID=991905 RepID=F2IY92_POLGS|nr:SRPBCC family protein [Polymorphum gilvum]ADZ71704.1 hypothetical protein SL003B_3282 [Polymorphum gilvum SL003B-26A1]